MARVSRISESVKRDVDVTPTIENIVFILLIFFIVTILFVREERLLNNKHKLNNSPSSESPVIVVKISETGQINFNGKLVDIEQYFLYVSLYINTK